MPEVHQGAAAPETPAVPDAHHHTGLIQPTSRYASDMLAQLMARHVGADGWAGVPQFIHHLAREGRLL